MGDERRGRAFGTKKVNGREINCWDASDRERTSTDGGGDANEDRWEVAWGAKAAAGRHAVAALTGTGCVTNARQMTTSAV